MLEFLKMCADNPEFGLGISLLFLVTLSSILAFILVLTGHIKLQ